MPEFTFIDVASGHRDRLDRDSGYTVRDLASERGLDTNRTQFSVNGSPADLDDEIKDDQRVTASPSKVAGAL